MNVSMYEVCLRKKIRFDTPKGQLSLEQLWDVPLRSRDDFNLNTVAKTANKAVKETSEESFVTTRKTTAQTEAELKLEVVKHVIEVKLDEEDRAERRAENAKRREKLMDALGKKEDATFEGMTEAQIKKELRKLDD